MSLNWKQWAPVASITAIPGSPVTAVPFPSFLPFPSFPGGIALFVANSDGEVHATAGIPADEGSWKDWTSVAEGVTTPGGAVTAVPWGEEFAVFVAGTEGEVFGTGGAPPTQRNPPSWGPWGSVSEGVATPGAPVAAVPWGEEFALFFAGADGTIFGTGGDPQGGFGPWSPMSKGGFTTPGAPVTAVAGVAISLFVMGFVNDPPPYGGIYAIAGDPQGGFGLFGWSVIGPRITGTILRAAPGSPVTAIASYEGGVYVRVFATSIDGIVTSTELIPGAVYWSYWEEWPGIVASPGAPIAVTGPGAARGIDLFVTDLNGRVMTTAGAEGGAGWDWVQGGLTAPGSLITPFYEGGPYMSVFVTGTDGRVFYTRATNYPG